MTLPTSGTITMGMVKTELGIASGTALTLTDSRVRALFSKPSGVIKLTDGYGKSADVAYRPISVVNVGLAPNDPTNAYDTPTIPMSVDTTTWNSQTTSHLKYDIRSQTYSFASGVSSGMLRVAIHSTVTGLHGEAASNVDISYSLDGGTSYSYTFAEMEANWSGGGSVTVPIIITKQLSNQDMSKLRVRVDVGTWYDPGDSVYISAGCAISDIVVY